MQSQSDAVPATAPPQAFVNSEARLSLSAKVREMTAEEARTNGNETRLWESVGNIVSNINLRYSNLGKEGREFEIDLHDLWFTYYHAAKNTSHDNPILDRLVLRVVQTRGIGPLDRGLGDEGGPATTSEGVIWTDLPYFAKDMMQFWDSDWATMCPSNRISFATFLAKLVAAGVCSGQLSMAGSALIREALETSRPLGTLKDIDAENSAALPEDITIASLLPAVSAWFLHAGYKLIELSCNNAIDRRNDIAAELLHITEPSSSNATDNGLSAERYLRWVTRLDELGRNARDAGDPPLGDYIERLLDSILATVGERDTSIRRKLAEPSSTIQHVPMVVEFPPAK